MAKKKKPKKQKPAKPASGKIATLDDGPTNPQPDPKGGGTR